MHKGNTWAVLATGPSMSQEIADRVRGVCRCVAVSDAWRLAPWADALVANDHAWWKNHPDALQFRGPKFAGCYTPIDGVTRLPYIGGFTTATNSGLQGMRVAEMMGAKRILLLGFDMHGSHFFGPHPAPLTNTSPDRFKKLIKQFDHWKGCEVVNLTPGSAIPHFAMGSLDDIEKLLQ